MKKPKTELYRNEDSSHQIFEYIDDFPINLSSMKDIETHQHEIENELENIFKEAFNRGTASKFLCIRIIRKATQSVCSALIIRYRSSERHKTHSTT